MLEQRLQEEMLTIVDEQDNVIGSLPRSEVYAKQMSNFRAVNAFIINQEGYLWIPRRAKDKPTFPFALDFSVGGHVENGEEYDAAFARELKEELDLNLQDLSYKTLGFATPGKHGTKAFSKVYEIQLDDTPDYCRKEFSGYYWLKPAMLMKKIAANDPHKDDLPILLQMFYL